jgi:membrane-associated phospholipid phosphatase
MTVASQAGDQRRRNRREQGSEEATAVLKSRARQVLLLIPDHARRPAAIAAACCLALVAVLGVLAAHRSSGNAVDRPVDRWLVRNLGSHTRALTDIVSLGDRLEVTVLTTILVLACLAVRRVNGAILAVISVVVAVGLTEFILKPLVHETIKGSLTYPSGHTASLFALIGVVGVLMLAPPGKRPRPILRLLVVLGLILVGCIVAVTLIALDYHYFTDTVAGAAVGIGIVLATSFLLDGSAMRRRLAAAWPGRRQT